MKTKTTIFKSLAITAIMVVSALAAMAQAPESFNYQAVIRDASGELNSNADMNVRFTIKEDGPSGTSIYREFVDLTSNEFGLINHAVGTGTVDLGTFEDIAWGDNGMFLQVEVSFNNGPYADLGTTQMVSVPYALEAKHADYTEHNASVAGSTVITIAAGVSTVNVNIPGGIPSAWGAVENHVALVTCADATSFRVLTSRVNGNNLMVIIDNPGIGGATRLNYIIFPTN